MILLIINYRLYDFFKCTYFLHIYSHFYIYLIYYRLFYYIINFRKRKLTTAMKHERLMTGGGPAPEQPNDPVMAFMDATNSNLDIDIDCPFDSTAVFEKECEHFASYKTLTNSNITSML